MYLKSNYWDGEAAQIFEGAAGGTDIGFTGDVSIERRYTFSEIKASQTGEQVLGRRILAAVFVVTIDFAEIGDANHFLKWWFDGHPVNTGVVDLHPGRNATLPTRRLRVHPLGLGVDTTKDFVFEALAPVSGPAMTLNGKGEHRHRIVFETEPVAAGLPVVNTGKFNYVPA